MIINECWPAMRMCRIEHPYCEVSIEADVDNRNSVFCTCCGKQIRIENDSSNINVLWNKETILVIRI